MENEEIYQVGYTKLKEYTKLIWVG